MGIKMSQQEQQQQQGGTVDKPSIKQIEFNNSAVGFTLHNNPSSYFPSSSPSNKLALKTKGRCHP